MLFLTLPLLCQAQVPAQQPAQQPAQEPAPAQVPAQAQQPRRPWPLRIVDALTRPSEKLDTSYLFQRKPQWNASLTSGLMQSRVRQENSFFLDGEGDEMVPATLNTELLERPFRQIGLQAGYGSMTLGYSLEIGRRSAEKRSAFLLDLMMAGQAVQIQYYNITQPMTYVLGIGNPGTSNYVEYASGSDFPGRQKVFMLDGFYALNRKRFAFNAAYTGYKVQRRTAGSFMLSLKYLQGEVLVDPNEGYTAYIGNLTRYGTNQVSLGAGYSLNLVAFHRQPSDGYGKGLRNLTFNLTLMPMVTPLNRLVTVMARYDEESDTYVEGSRNAIWGDVRLNYTTRGAVAWSFGRCCASITASYDTFTFQSSKSQDKNFAQVHSLETKAVFDKWQVNFRVNFHF